MANMVVRITGWPIRFTCLPLALRRYVLLPLFVYYKLFSIRKSLFYFAQISSFPMSNYQRFLVAVVNRLKDVLYIVIHNKTKSVWGCCHDAVFCISIVHFIERPRLPIKKGPIGSKVCMPTSIKPILRMLQQDTILLSLSSSVGRRSSNNRQTNLLTTDWKGCYKTYVPYI